MLALLLLFGTASTALWIVDDDYVEFMKIQNTVVAESSGDITSKTLAVKSAALKEEWNKTFGGTYDDLASSVQQTADGGYIFVRQPESQDAGFNDTGLVKTDSNGNEQWNKTFGRTDKDFANSVKQTTDGGYIIAGGMVSYSTGYYDARLMKTDSNGNEQWNKTFGGTRNDVAYSVQQTTDGGYIIAGGTESYGAGSYDAWLIKVKGELREPTEMPITPEPIKPTQMPVTTPTETTPAFEVIFAISGLLAVAYIVKKKKEVL